jgi:hypothetical protein
VRLPTYRIGLVGWQRVDTGEADTENVILTSEAHGQDSNSRTTVLYIASGWVTQYNEEEAARLTEHFQKLLVLDELAAI